MKILIVGAGLYGATLARSLAEADHNITLIDRRDHIGGNCYDAFTSKGIRYHLYGPHIFHTSNAAVIAFAKRFATWIDYRHHVKAQLQDGRLVPFPVTSETLLHVKRDDILDVFYRPYSKKMWGVDLEELDPSILSRVPIDPRGSGDYFPNDDFVGFPENGYTAWIGEILKHKHIHVDLRSPFIRGMEDHYDFCFSSAPIDEYFDFSLGRLPYRSIKFHHIDLPVARVYDTPVINFTDHGPMTRVTEWKNFPGHGHESFWTRLTFEEPCADHENNFERYYPVKDRKGEYRALYRRYQALVPSHMRFIGRTGLYAYLDMHQAIASALALADEYINPSNQR